MSLCDFFKKFHKKPKTFVCVTCKQTYPRSEETKSHQCCVCSAFKVIRTK